MTNLKKSKYNDLKYIYTQQKFYSIPSDCIDIYCILRYLVQSIIFLLYAAYNTGYFSKHTLLR